MTENKDRVNLISISEFANKKDFEPVQYVFPEIPSRENFASLLMKSFAFSGGDVVKQAVYFQWISNKTGFDSENTLANFKFLGWGFLTNTERQQFLDSFISVKGHHRPENAIFVEGMKNDPSSYLNLMLVDLVAEKNRKAAEMVFQQFRCSQAESETELRSKVKDWEKNLKTQ